MKLALLAALLAAPLAAGPATAAQPAPTAPLAAAPAPGANKLFADSRLVVRDRISVEVVGRGPDVVLIPGLASSRETWRATAERLRGRYRLHLVQVAGFAGEPARANAAGEVVDPTIAAIDAYIVEARLKRPAIIGHSLGGTMSLALAQRHPEHLGKVMLVDALPFFGVLMGGPSATSESVRPIADKMRAMAAAPAGDYRKAGRPMIEGMVSAPADVDRVLDWGAASDPSVVARSTAEDIVLDLRPGLPATKPPITLLYPFDPKFGVPQATFDGLYGGAYADLPGKRLIRVDGARHFIMLDQPERFAREVDAFLAAP